MALISLFLRDSEPRALSAHISFGTQDLRFKRNLAARARRRSEIVIPSWVFEELHGQSNIRCLYGFLSLFCGEMGYHVWFLGF
jgi:hypothetical protein